MDGGNSPPKAPQDAHPQAPAATGSQDLLAVNVGAAVLVTLNRPRALNALTHAMRLAFSDVLARASRDPNTYCVVLQSSLPKAFCAGSDVREILTAAATDMPLARRYFAEEYARNWHCECFSKPTISLINGIVMGGGVGISLYGTHRVAGEGYRFAMPETAIGLFPDVGTCHAFARMPGQMGVYLGLTGRQIGRADAYELGLVTHCMPSARFDEIISNLAAAEPVDAILDGLHEPPGPGEMASRRETIAQCFSASTVEEIVARLQSVSGTNKDWAQDILSELLKRSPLSLKITLRHIREAASLDLRETLHRDYRLGCHCLDGQDFAEGVRALLIDKDGAPKWQPARLEDVNTALVDRYFSVRAEGEPVLPTRADMQAARA